MIDDVKVRAKEGQSTDNGRLGLEFIDLDEVKPQPEALDMVSGDFALNHQVLPMRIDGETLVVAIGGIDSLRAADDLGVLTGKPIQPVLADPILIRQRIEDRFLEGMIADLPGDDAGVIDVDETTDLADLQKMAGEAAVVQLVNLVFAQAVRDGVSDVHIEPYEREVKIRFRVDGILSDAFTPPKRMHAAIVSRIKILAEMNIAERES